MTHPALGWTLRKCYDEFYDRSELATATVALHGFTLLRWEKLTANPAVGEITTETLSEFRERLISSGLRPATINITRRVLRAIFRRLAPPFDKNPRGMNILPAVPYFKPVKDPRPIPRLISQEDLSRAYLGANQMDVPRLGVPSPWWWQTLFCCAYFLGLRKRDVLTLRTERIDLDNGLLYQQAAKTGKLDAFPMHPVLVAHVKQILVPGSEYLFQNRGGYIEGGDFGRCLRRIQQAGKVSHPFTMKHFRSTACSELEMTPSGRGLGGVFLQHHPRDVTNTHYWNATETLRTAIEEMRVPLAFRHAIPMRQRAVQKSREELARIALACRVSQPTCPDPAEWQFAKGWFSIRGQSGAMTGAAYRVLKTLAESAPNPVGFDTLCDVVYQQEHQHRPTDRKRLSSEVCGIVSYLRQRLRLILRLEDAFNPVPCQRKGGGGEWTLYLPSFGREGAA